MVRTGERVDIQLGMCRIKQAKPHGNGGENAGNFHSIILLVECERVCVGLFTPKVLIQAFALVFSFIVQFFGRNRLVRDTGHIGEATQCLDAQTTLV